MNEEADIKALLAARLAGLETRDAKASLQGLGSETVLFDLAPPLVISGDQAVDPVRVKQWFDTWDGPITTEMRDLVVRANGDLAFAHALIRMSGARKDSVPGDFWFRSTICLERTGGAWRIVHEHNSFPMLMDGSGKSATELDP